MPTINQLPADSALQSTDKFLIEDAGGTKTATVQQMLDLVARNTDGIPNGRMYFVYDDTTYPSPLEVENLDLYRFEPKNSTIADDNVYATAADTLTVGANVSSLIFGKAALAVDGYVYIVNKDGDVHFTTVTDTDGSGRTITLETDFDDYEDFDINELGNVVVFYTGEVNLDGGGETYTAGDGLDLSADNEFSVDDTVVRADGSVTMNYLELDATTPYIEVGSNIALSDLLDDSTDYPFEIDIHHNIPNLQEDGVYSRQGGGLYWITESDATDTSLKLWNEQVSRDRNDVTISRKSIIEHSPGEMTFYTNTSNVANDYDNDDRILKVGPDTVEMFEGLDATVNGQRFIIRNETASDNPLIDFISTNSSVVGGLRGYRNSTDFDRGSLVLHRHTSGDTYWSFDVWDGQNTAALRVGADDGADAGVYSLVPFMFQSRASDPAIATPGAVYYNSGSGSTGRLRLRDQNGYDDIPTEKSNNIWEGDQDFEGSITFKGGASRARTDWQSSLTSSEYSTGSDDDQEADNKIGERVVTANLLNNDSDPGVVARVFGGEYEFMQIDSANTNRWTSTEVYQRPRAFANTNQISAKTSIRQDHDRFIWLYNTSNDTDFDWDGTDRMFELDSTRATFFDGLRLSGIGGTGNHLTISADGDVTRTTISGGGDAFSQTDSYDLQGNNDFNWTGSAIAGSSTFYTAADDDLVIRNTGTDADTPTVSFLSSNNSLLGGFKLYRTSISDNTERGALLFHRESNGNTFARLQYFNTTYKNGLTIGETDRITSHVDHFFSGDINVTSGNNATFQGNITVSGTSTLSGAVTVSAGNAFIANGNVTLGNGSSDIIDIGGRIHSNITQINSEGTIANQIISTMPNGGFDDNDEGDALTYILNTSAYDQGAETSVFNANFAQETWTTQHDTDAADLFFDREVRSLDRDSGHAVEGKSLIRQEHDQLTWWSKTGSTDFADADRIFQMDRSASYFGVPIRVGGNEAKYELDVYREDTWTPDASGLVATDNSTDFVNVDANYIKIGRLVHCYARIGIPANTDTSPIAFTKTSLPFTLVAGSLNGSVSGRNITDANQSTPSTSSSTAGAMWEATLDIRMSLGHDAGDAYDNVSDNTLWIAFTYYTTQ